ncbi:MAG: hypothetical protein IJX63_15735 [Lachnospiraceae bacterium]|nr:hypothetical protein [Lachnospiraceae bacterium]
MINEERIVLMTKLTSYEKREGKESMAIGRYFRGDYISLHLLKSVILATIAYAVGVGLYLLYNFEDLLEEIYNLDFAYMAKNFISIYVIFVVAYCSLTYVIFTYRYVKARKSIRRYQHNLKKLSAMYCQ